MASSSTMMTAKSVLSTVGSAAAAVMVARAVINDFLPYEVRDYLFSSIHSIFSRRFSTEITMIIEEFDGLESNQIFDAIELFIGALTKTTSTSASATRLMVRKPVSGGEILVNVDRNEEIIDEFEGIKFRWMLRCHTIQSNNEFYQPRDMNSALRSEQSEFLKMETKTIKLFTNNRNAWTSITLNHPATFETVVMDTELKRMIIDDLDRFLKRKEYYRHVGKVWKRGYLLYGPPGTGKSSLIAAMANYLNFDVYDLELSGLRFDSELRNALVGTANKSIVVVEDIDSSIELNNRENEDGSCGFPLRGRTRRIRVSTRCFFEGQQQEDKVTLSGLLNFIDGLWSSCGDERIIIFTKNHKEKLDPALLRPGRMDMHIHMSYCTPCGFKLLANNYLGVKHHELFTDIEKLVEETNVTPAEVAEQLMKHDKPDPALRGLVEFLQLKKVDEANAEAKKLDDESKPKENDNKNDVNDGEDEGC
uniref:AAA+ ATPase domain-containing protein n=1 Tax=Chenopodium quinoa TaxID=63459 RepID=A0A803KYI4_CHEQI